MFNINISKHSYYQYMGYEKRYEIKEFEREHRCNWLLSSSL